MTSPPARAWVGLGANLGDAPATLQQALGWIDQWPGVQVQAVSPLYRSAPIDAEGPDFFNAVARLSTTLAPLPLLHALLALELRAGRERPWRNAPRTLDLDVLRYEHHGQALICESVELTLPHPRMHQRAFVLRPLADIDPDLVPNAWLQAVQDQRLQPWPWP